MNENKKMYILGIFLIIFNFLLVNYVIVFQKFSEFLSIISPFILGILMAYILSNLMFLLEKKFNLKRIYSFLITYVIFFLTIFLLIFTIIPSISKNIIDLLSNLSTYIFKIENFSNNILTNFKILNKLNLTKYLIGAITSLTKGAAYIFNYILKFTLSSVVSIAGTFVQFLMISIISMYVLYDIENFKKKFNRYISGIFGINKSKKLYEILGMSNEIFKKFFIGQLLDALLVGIICFIGLSIISVPYAFLLSLLVAIFNMIPYLGPILGGIPVVIIALLDNPSKAIYCIVFMLILQQIEGNILAPRILGNSVGISSFAILLSIALGGAYFGILGMFLAVPIFKIIIILFDEFIDKRLSN